MQRSTGLIRFSLNGLPAPRLRHKILAVVTGSLLLAEVVVLGFAYLVMNYDSYRQQEAQTLLMLKANIDAASYPSVQDVVRMGQRIANFTDVKGGVIYNRRGETIASFGERPQLSYATVRQDKVLRAFGAQGRHVDIYFPTEDTGMANPLVLRLDTSGIPQQVWVSLKGKILITAIAALLTSVLAVFALSFTVLRPINRLRTQARAAADNPAHADNEKLNWKRGDELGDLAAALDSLMNRAALGQSDVHQLRESALEHMVFPMFMLEGAGELRHANRAARTLFGAETLDEIKPLVQHCVVEPFSHSPEQNSLLALTTKGPLIEAVKLATPLGLQHCAVNHIPVQPRGCLVPHHILVVVNAALLNAGDLHLAATVKKLEASNERLREQAREMRQLLQSCIAMFANSADALSSAQDKADSHGAAHTAQNTAINALRKAASLA